MTKTSKAPVVSFKMGAVVALREEAVMFFDASRANVLHEVVDYCRSGYTIAPIQAVGVDWERTVLVMPEDLREVKC